MSCTQQFENSETCSNDAYEGQVLCLPCIIASLVSLNDKVDQLTHELSELKVSKSGANKKTLDGITCSGNKKNGSECTQSAHAESQEKTGKLLCTVHMREELIKQGKIVKPAVSTKTTKSTAVRETCVAIVGNTGATCTKPMSKESRLEVNLPLCGVHLRSYKLKPNKFAYDPIKLSQSESSTMDASIDNNEIVEPASAPAVVAPVTAIQRPAGAPKVSPKVGPVTRASNRVAVAKTVITAPVAAEPAVPVTQPVQVAPKLATRPAVPGRRLPVSKPVKEISPSVEEYDEDEDDFNPDN